jgi:hypothetical protein
MSLLQAGFGSSGEYTIDDSLRFRASATAYLDRTFSTPTDNKKWTYSIWFKRGTIGARNCFFSTYNGGSGIDFVRFNTDATITISWTGTVYNLITTPVYRDPSAWYHIIISTDLTQAIAGNRCKLYVNGNQITAFGTNDPPPQNYASQQFNSAMVHNIGRFFSSNYVDGYLTEINFIDGQALTADDFGEFDDNGTWKPLAYTGTYGTNGFYLNGVGVTDESGNGNDWTNNNLNLSTSTAATYDQMKDTPSLVDENAGNFATLNPLKNYNNTLADGNLNISATSASTTTIVLATIGVSSGKWYWEFTQTAYTVNNTPMIGIAKDNVSMTAYVGSDANGWGYYGNNGDKYNSATGTAYGASYTNNDVIGVAFDADAGTLVFYKNSVSQGTAFTGLTSGPYFPAFSDAGSTVVMTANANFGQRPFAYTPPSGFLKLNTFNLPDSTIEKGSDYFNTVLYTGNGSTQSITGVGFQPDWTWIKNRDAADAHVLTDAVRGATEELQSNALSAETTNADGLTAFDTDGFSLGADVLYNTSSEAYVAWNWLASNTTVSNAVGDIPSTVSVNTTSGFSIVVYTGNGLSNQTVGHSLSQDLAMLIVKSRTGGPFQWRTWHKSLSGPTYYVSLSSTVAENTSSTVFNGQSSTTFTVGDDPSVNTSGYSVIAYCFAEVPGYSAIGSYTGNASTDGPFVYTGFRPAFVMVKRTDNTSNWYTYDSSRNTANPESLALYPNAAYTEDTEIYVDFLSNGFKCRSATVGNVSGATYIYMAFAENPFKNSNAR